MFLARELGSENNSSVVENGPMNCPGHVLIFVAPALGAIRYLPLLLARMASLPPQRAQSVRLHVIMSGARLHLRLRRAYFSLMPLTSSTRVEAIAVLLRIAGPVVIYRRISVSVWLTAKSRRPARRIMTGSSRFGNACASTSLNGGRSKRPGL